MKVYDLLGRDVTTLVDNRQNAGTYKTKFDARNKASGIYFYKLDAGNFHEAKKMILEK